MVPSDLRKIVLRDRCDSMWIWICESADNNFWWSRQPFMRVEGRAWQNADDVIYGLRKNKGKKILYLFFFFFFFPEVRMEKAFRYFYYFMFHLFGTFGEKKYFCNHSFLLLILSSITFYYLFFYFSLWPPKYTLSKTCGKITDWYSLLLLQWWKHLQFWPIAQQLRWDKEKSYNTFLFI